MEEPQRGFDPLEEEETTLTEENSELDERNDETFMNSVDLDFSWEIEHQQFASKLEEEKRERLFQEKPFKELNKGLDSLTLQSHYYEDTEVQAPLNRGKLRNDPKSSKVSQLWGQPLIELERSPSLLLERERENEKLGSFPRNLESLGTQKKVLFAEDLEKSLLAKTEAPQGEAPTWSQIFSRERDSFPKYAGPLGHFSPKAEKERFYQQSSQPMQTGSAAFRERRDNVFREHVLDRKLSNEEYPELRDSLSQRYKPDNRACQRELPTMKDSFPGWNSRETQRRGANRKRMENQHERRRERQQYKRSISSRLHSKWMSSHDIELIAKMHIRQLETSSLLTEDFYCQNLKKQTAKGNASSEKKHYLEKKKKEKVGYFPHHSENNLKARPWYIQGYNPNAPRRMVQVTHELLMENASEVDSTRSSETLFSEDLRITVQFMIAEAYDVLFEIEDILNGHIAVSDEEEAIVRLTQRLYNIFRISESDNISVSNKTVFTKLCTLEKGRKLQIRILSLLPSSYVGSLLKMIFYCLGMVLKRVNKQQIMEPMWKDWFNTISDAIESIEYVSLFTDIFHYFLAGNEDNSLFLQVVSTEPSLVLVSNLLSFSFETEYFTDHNLKRVLGEFCEKLVLHVESMFEQVDHSIVWKVIALLDGFIEDPLRDRLRATLRQLIEMQRISLS
eukprot:jgi/Galph1/3183/GphlegSOOS_G1867.1